MLKLLKYNHKSLIWNFIPVIQDNILHMHTLESVRDLKYICQYSKLKAHFSFKRFVLKEKYISRWKRVWYFNLLTTKLNKLNFHPLEVVFKWEKITHICIILDQSFPNIDV